MSDSEFAIGQRWVSSSEAELGLGIVKEVSGRRIELTFPAAGESRTYAVANAPLNRVIYQIGDKVNTTDERHFVITERNAFNGCYIYQGTDGQGIEVSIHEMDLDSHVQFSQPQDRLFAGQIDKNSQFELRAKALAHQHRLQQSDLFGLAGARVQLLPHQLYIAHQVSQRYAPRVLLADEVGLGKTIEAGMILHRQLLTSQAKRVLIIVPDSLLHQWLVEMLRRFNLQFTIIDAERYSALQELNEGNPFDSAQLILCGLADLISSPQMMHDSIESSWDLLIVDEAHHLQWHTDSVSPEYKYIEVLAGQVPGLLLLTATPEQLGIESHFARLRLLDPDRYYDLEKFKEEEAAYQPVSELVQYLLDEQVRDKLDSEPKLKQQLSKYLGQEAIQSLLNADDFVTARNAIVQQLLDQHGTGRILFRNTRDVVRGFPQRQLKSYALNVPETFEVSEAFYASLQPENQFGSDWLEQDLRVVWLADWLKKNRDEKVLLICAQAETAQQLENCMRIQHGCRSAVFHEHMSLVNRDRAAAYFAEEEAGAQLLVCSEIGSEGRNFQFAQHLILFDLPLQPDLLEQRIGRLDRIGQQHTIHIHVPFYTNTAQQVLHDWYHEGLNAFERVMPAGTEIYDQLSEGLHKCLQTPSDETQKSALIKQTQERTEIVLNRLQQGRDRLLELNSFNETVANALISEIELNTNALELADFMGEVFDQFGVDHQPHSSNTIIAEPGNHMLYPSFPGLPEDGATATYQRSKALSREDMFFLSWEHPMVLGALDLIIHSEFGNSAFCTLHDHKLPAGTLLLEAIYRLNCTAPKSLMAQRYINNSYLRFVIDMQGQDHSDRLDETTFKHLAGRIPKATVQELVRHARPQINTLIAKSKAHTDKHQQTLISDAVEIMHEKFKAELKRMLELQKVNANIRQQEIDHLTEVESSLAQHLQGSKLILDALRVAIVTEPN